MNYDERLEIRLSSAQKLQFELIAGKQGHNVSQFIRSLVLCEPTPQELEINEEISHELSRMGNNLNQIAKVLNSTRMSSMPIPATSVIELKADLQLAIEKISDLQKQLKR